MRPMCMSQVGISARAEQSPNASWHFSLLFKDVDHVTAPSRGPDETQDQRKCLMV